jgi:hypothetical protein
VSDRGVSDRLSVKVTGDAVMRPNGTPKKPEAWMSLIEDGADILHEELPPVTEIVVGIVAEFSKLSIVSSAKSFKTWLTIYLALCISHGLPFLGRETTRRRVLYVNLELKVKTFKRRIQAIARALGMADLDRNWFVHLPLRGELAGVKTQCFVDRVVAIAHQLNTGVIVVDPLFKINTEGDENSTQHQTILMNEVDRFTTKGGCTVILNDHSGKGNQSEKDPLDVIRGSSAKGGDIDAAMVLRQHDVKHCYRVDLVHRELCPVDAFVIGWEYPLMVLRPDLDPEAMRKPKGGRPRTHEPAELLATILDRTAENPISISAWARAAGVTRQTLQGHLMQMRLKGWLMTAGEGNSARQYPTEKGRKAVEESL